MGDTEDLPYKAEYSKSSRASCRSCKTQIEKGVLRLAVMIQSPMFDGKVPHWYHMHCFFGKQRPKTVGDIAHFEALRYDDQEKIKDKIANATDIVVPAKKGKKRGKSDGASSSKGALGLFCIEYAKSGRAGCRGCEQKILKDEIRISKKDFETDVGKRYGGQDMWHHLDCFAKLRSELAYFETGEMLPGFQSLSIEDKKKVKTQLPAIKQEEVPIKKPKMEDETDGKNSEKEKEIKEQNKIIFKYRDNLKDNLNKKELQNLLEYNDQDIPVGVDTMLDRLGDIMTFGALENCPKCSGQFVFNKNSYVCAGDLTEWAKCQNRIEVPKRKPFKVPQELKEQYSFLNKYKYKPKTRVFNFVPSTESLKKDIKKDEENTKPRVEREKPALYEMKFVITGVGKNKSKLSKEIKRLGGKVIDSMNRPEDKPMAVISTPDNMDEDNLSKHIQAAKNWDVHVVSMDFVDEAKDNVGKIPELVIKKSICSWGSDPKLRLPDDEAQKSANKSAKSKSIYTKSVPKSVTMKIKGGGAVDPDSGLEDVAHVYQSGKDKYTCVLGLTDLQTGKNSFYKLQLLESDNKNRFWVFRAWGRISTTIGGNKLEDMSNLHDAKRHFKSLYEEKTGNLWEDRDNFVKVPGRMYPIDIDYDHGEEENMTIAENDPSKLKQPIQDLIRIIFDVNMMKKVMLEFELDTEKMPLGKLSKKQIQSAFSVLSELQNLVNNNGDNHRFIDASNRFYTFIPHSFGMDNPPLINTSEMIKEKLDMLDSLMELEIAYSLMKTSGDSKGSGSTLDHHYNQLKTEIDVVPKDSEEFKLLKEYVKNTHAATHTNYELEVEEVFTVKRQGEEKRFKPFKKLHNHKLLWHGSRITNFAGILAQGLRIAPPEAPVTGYMFGKGIYFADMVSKSANYCCASPANNTGLLLLCDVALGEMYERENADYIEKLPKGKHSCKGMGMTAPDPGKSVVKDGIEIPLGKGKKMDGLRSSLLYNEYIVYDIAQVNVKYLMKMNFKYNY